MNPGHLPPAPPRRTQARQTQPAVNNRGSALLIAVLLLLVLGLGSAASWRAMHQEFHGAQEQRMHDAAYYLAEAGLEQGLAALRQDPYYRGETRTPLGDGAFTVAVTPLEPGGYRLESSGLPEQEELRRPRVVLHARIRLDAAGRLREYIRERPGDQP